MDDFKDECLLYARTVQASVIKVLIEALKDLIFDTELVFDSDGIRVVDLDNTRVVMVHLRLDAEKFETFVCTEPVRIGINLGNLYKLLKTVGNSDTLTMFLEKGDRSRLGIRLESEERRAKTEFKINLLDVKSRPINIPPVEFSSCVILSSTDFQKIIRDMYSISDRVEIRNVQNRLFLTCKGDFCQQETVLEESDKFADASHGGGAGDIIQGVFCLKYLALFCKCSSLCSSVEVNMKNDYPLVVRYAVASLGELKLCLTPKSNDDDEYDE